ncbi:MAG: phytoene/squalene synthase family protein [Patescibacteria group bacterium]|nr:phytoene/squalene synthase family protein [Patescibacteria group bacterium]
MKISDFIRKYGKNYYFASLFLPKNTMEDVFSFYAFVRFFDDIVDEENNLNKFYEYKNKFMREIEIKKSDFQIFEENFKIIKRYKIPKEYFLDFLKSMEMDFKIKRYKSWDELNNYIYGSAEVIGLILLKIFGSKNLEAEIYAKKLGYAMQLTNFLRDFGEDYYKRNRVYFPEEELNKFGIDFKNINSKIVDQNLINFIIFQIKNIKKYYKEAKIGIKWIKCRRCQFAVFLAANLYQNILNKIIKNKYDILNKRAFNKKFDFLIITLKSFIEFLIKNFKR